MFDDASFSIVSDSAYRWNLRSVSFSVGNAPPAPDVDADSTGFRARAKSDRTAKPREPSRTPTFDSPSPWNEALFVPRGLAGMTLPQIERLALLETLVACGGCRSRAARKLGVSEKTIYNKIRRYKIDAETLERFAASYYPN